MSETAQAEPVTNGAHVEANQVAQPQVASNGVAVAKPSDAKTLEQAIARTEVACDERGALLPRSFDQIWRVATAIHRSGVARKSFDTVEQVFIAIAYGAELGIQPMQSINSFAVINGRVSMWGDMQVALAMPALEVFEEWYEDGDGRIDLEAAGWSKRLEVAVANTTLVAVCRGKRAGRPTICRESFSMMDAKRAGLLNNDKTPWPKYPARMCQWRASGWVLRKVAADILRGVIAVEDAYELPPLDSAAKQPTALADRLKSKALSLAANGTDVPAEIAN